MKTVTNSNTAKQPEQAKKQNIHVVMYASKVDLGQTCMVNALADILNPDSINERAKELEVIKYERQFQPAGAVLSNIGFHADGHEDDHNRFAAWCKHYRNFVSEKHHLHDKPMHNQMRTDEMTTLAREVTQALINVAHSAGVMTTTARAMYEQMHSIGIEDIVAHDGTIINIRRACANTIEHVKLGGRPKVERSGRATSHRNAGNSHSCAVKAHCSFSILNRSISFISITGGTSSETEELPLGLKNNLIIMDRGYDQGTKMLDSILESGNHFVVRLKNNHTYRVKRAFDSVSSKHKNRHFKT